MIALAKMPKIFSGAFVDAQRWATLVFRLSISNIAAVDIACAAWDFCAP